jgi:hypothetical protein
MSPATEFPDLPMNAAAEPPRLPLAGGGKQEEPRQPAPAEAAA